MRPYLNLMPQTERCNKNGLFVEKVPLSKILEVVDTPVYVTSLNAVYDRISTYKKTLSQHFINSNIFYACKANFAKPILQEVLLAGGGIDIVSLGEWHAALSSGCLPKDICFAGVGKKDSEWKTAILNNIGYLNVEHLEELDNVLDFIVDGKRELTSIPIISLRLNPCLEIETHPHLKTGSLDSKFGILFEHFKAWLLSKKQTLSSDKFLKWINPLKGIHVHIGSQLMAQDIFTFTIKNVFDCAQFMYENGVFINHLDLGGGLGVSVSGVPSQGEDIIKHVHFLSSTIKDQAIHYPGLMNLWCHDFSKLCVSLEPGRSVVASSTLFLTKVLYTKINSPEFRFCYVDGAMNDFPRPSLYGAVHHVEIANFTDLPLEGEIENFTWRIVGPVCESGDFLSKNALLPKINRNDIIAFFEAGAYCRSMASEYNLRPLPNEIFIKGNDIKDVIIRKTF